MEAAPLVGLLRRPWLPLALACLATGVTLGAAWGLKAPCLAHDWDGYQYGHGCYNELQPLYGIRGFGNETVPVPYVDAFNEYPPVTGMFQYAMARLSSDVTSFFVLNALFLSLFALGTTAVLADALPRAGLPFSRIFWWALGPPLALYAFSNWDLLATFPLVAGLALHRRGRDLAAGACIALAAGAKFYPIFLLPILGIATLREEGRLGPRSWRFGLGAGAALAACTVPFLLLDANLFLESFRFHSERVFSYETLWSVIAHDAPGWGHPAWQAWLFGDGLDRWSQGLILLSVAGLTALTALRRLDPWAACFAMVLAFLLFNKFYSVQYGLWVLPFVALVRVPARLAAFWMVADFLFFTAFFAFFEVGTTDDPLYFDMLSATIVLRTLAFLALLGWLLRPAFRRRTPAPEPAEEPPAAPPPAGAA